MKVVEVVGEGTFGVVHKAIWRGTVVAAKVISVPCGSEDGVIKEIEMCRYAIREHTMALFVVRLQINYCSNNIRCILNAVSAIPVLDRKRLSLHLGIVLSGFSCTQAVHS